METPARHLLFHASIVLLIALLCGIPYGRAITHKQSEEAIRAWKLAHGALSLGAISMIGVAAVLSFLNVNAEVQWALAIAFIISGYGFSIALTVEPFIGNRGLSWSGTWSNKFVFVGNVIGALSSLIGSFLLVYASYVSL
jgi:hypothetical protein